jgi:hypothetical protein
VGVCEAVKLYLDAPGLVFVLACDLSVLSRGVAAQARGGAGEGRTYLEKIVQVAHRVPVPDTDHVHRLIREYATRSGTLALIDKPVAETLAELTARNPRRIKRIINSFVLEYNLNPGWHRPPLGSTELMTTVLLQHLYPTFYDILAREDSGEDPIGEFLDYADVRARASDPPPPGDAWWSTASQTLRRYGMRAPDRSMPNMFAGWDMQELENLVPEEFRELARSTAFLALLQGVGDPQSRRAVRAQLTSRPLGTEALPDQPA